MHICVLIKQVPDPEGPRDAFVINQTELRVDPQGIPPVLSLFDENALEAALRLKDSLGGQAKVTVVSIGKRVANAVMLKALAAGADDLVKLEDETLNPSELDSAASASVIAALIRKIGDVDLVFAGRQSADVNASQTGIRVGELLDLPVITFARSVRVEDGRATVERIVPGGTETVRCRLPVMIMAGNEAGELRYPTMIQRRDAKNKPITAWGLADLDGAAALDKTVTLLELHPQIFTRGSCTFIESGPEAGRNLAKRLVADGVL